MTDEQQWVPEWAAYFSIKTCAAPMVGGLDIQFYNSNPERIVVHPISELPAMLARNDVVQQIRQRNKYDREIKPGVWVDVYDVLRAFKVTGGAVAHAVIRLLTGKQERQDLTEARDSLDRAIQQIDEWV
jgi:hypothetical protein